MRDEDDEMDPAADPGRLSCARALTLRTPSGHSTILYTETRDILQKFFFVVVYDYVWTWVRFSVTTRVSVSTLDI